MPAIGESILSRAPNLPMLSPRFHPRPKPRRRTSFRCTAVERSADGRKGLRFRFSHESIASMLRLRPSLAAFLLFAATLPVATVQAQWSIDFAFGGGPHCHHRPHYHGYYGYYGWYRPYPVYVAPPPVYYTQPVAVPTAASAPLATLPTAASAAQPSLRANGLPGSQSSVRIRNPSNSGGGVSFVVEGKSEINLAPGDSQYLGERNAYLVEFDRGANFGTFRRELVAGTYDFVVTENGWDLQRVPVESSSTAVEATVRRNTLPNSR